MELTQAIDTYFRGEKMVAFGLIALGIALLAVAAWVWRTQEGPFATALIVPLALVGIGAPIGGALFAWKTDRQVAELHEALEAEPEATLEAERARMEKVNANWPRLKLAWGALAIVALVLLLVVKREWATGLGLALMLLVTALFFVDVFAERRAEPYAEALDSASPQATRSSDSSAGTPMRSGNP